jgi:hypothetical protein
MEGYLTPALAHQWKTVYKPRLFATKKQFGRVLNLTLWRDDDVDGDAVKIEVRQVLVIVGSGSGRPGIGAIRRGDAAEITISVGEFRREHPFNVRDGDRFTLPETFPELGGVSGVISEPPVDAGAYIRAPFRLGE